MKKIEQVYREILYNVIEKKNNRFTQLGLAKKLQISLSTVNFALKKLQKIGSIKIGKMGFNILDVKKILYLWASERDIKKDILFSARINLPVVEIEKNMPNVVFGGYSAYKFKFKDVPADYSEVYVYSDESQLNEIKNRLGRFSDKNFKNPNLFVLKKADKEIDYGKTSTISQIFVDLWNLKEWYASEFIKKLEEKLNLK